MKILLMEDDAVLSDILLDYLRESYTVVYAFNSQKVVKLLEKENFDLFIFDINVTGKNGLDLLEDLRSFSDTTPTIFITAYTDTAYLKRAFELGAHDYIKKPFELEELTARIENTKRIFNIESISKEVIGIAKDKLDEIFKRFVRANSYAGGFGVGLSIAESIIKEYNYQITIESELEVGTTVKILFK